MRHRERRLDWETLGMAGLLALACSGADRSHGASSPGGEGGNPPAASGGAEALVETGAGEAGRSRSATEGGSDSPAEGGRAGEVALPGGGAGGAGGPRDPPCAAGEVSVPGGCLALFGSLPEVPGNAIDPPDPDAPVVVLFAPDVPQGEAPFGARLRWRVSSPSGEALTCRVDVDGDGLFDTTIEDCSDGTLDHLYRSPGRYTPVLEVTDASGRSTTRAELVYANHLVFAEGVVRLSNLAGLVQETHDDTTVSLEFEEAELVPNLQPSDLVFNGGGDGYVRAVTGIARDDRMLVLTTEPRSFFDAFASGFYGIRRPPIVKTDPDSDTALTSLEGQNKSLWDGFAIDEQRYRLSIPVPVDLRLSYQGLDLQFAGNELTAELYVGYLELDVANRTLSGYIDSSTSFSSRISLGSADGRDTPRVSAEWPIPLPALGIAVRTGVGFDLNVGLTLVTGTAVEGRIAFAANATLGAGTATRFSLSPSGNSAEVRPRSLSSIGDVAIEAEASAKLYKKAEFGVTFGKPNDDCIDPTRSEWAGLKAAAWTEAGFRATGAGSLVPNRGAAELCVDLEAYSEAGVTLALNLGQLCAEAEGSTPGPSNPILEHCWSVDGAGGAGGAGPGANAGANNGGANNGGANNGGANNGGANN
ncbi:MAG: hypothetical protein JW751_20230, partial [Polyangiaceae bacterium]|nr:hypothetical protein [Polyangiaceae bacterium]